MEITFVNHYSGDAPKRRRLAQACSVCRQRKKRCIHFAKTDDPDGADNELSTSPEVASERTPTLQATEKRTSSSTSRALTGQPVLNGSSQANSSTQQPQPRVPFDHGRARFVSDLTPEATLLNRPAPSEGNSGKQPNDDIGVWVDRREWDSLVPQGSDAATANPVFGPNQRPPPSVVNPLIDIYFAKIHPILPFLDEQDFRRHRMNNKVPEPLLHAMCLVASKDIEAEPHLKLSDSTTTTSPRQFCSMLHGSITKALKGTIRFDKITLIRILALTSLHTQGIEGAEEASILLSQAMHYAQTLGIHLGIQASAPVGKELEMKRLFWCLWALDRSNAATNGRPVIMSDIDVAIDGFAPGESGFPAFEAWLRVAKLLNTVIDFYRPTSDVSATGWEGEYPGLEEIIDEVGGWQLSPSPLATIHLFYLSVGILSHRTRGFREIPRGISSSVRQRLCAIEIVRLLTASTSPPLHPLPIIPYAIALALSVSYQHLRQSQLEHQQADAREDFRTCCKLLQTLRRTWCSADIMATLAKKVLDQLDRAPSLVSYRIPRRYTQGSAGEGQQVETDIIPPPSACVHGGEGGVGGAAAGAAADDVNGIGEAPDVPVASAAAAAAEEQQAALPSGLDLFDNVDDVFGTFMDPNYPLNLDDIPFFNDFTPIDWNGDLSIQS